MTEMKPDDSNNNIVSIILASFSGSAIKFLHGDA